jgi:peptidoglycan/LPS O-acetylase OafA/YrhL
MLKLTIHLTFFMIDLLVNLAERTSMQITQLTFTRFLASLSIVILHFGLFNWPMNTHYISRFGGDLINGITYFFVLSGFILVISNAKDGQLPQQIERKSFWKRRFARVYPVYLLSVILFFALQFKYNPNIPLEWQTNPYYYSVFLLQSWNYKLVLDINFPAWSLSVEAFFYLIFPWIYFNISRLKSTSIVVLALISWYLNILAVDSLSAEKAPQLFINFFPLLHLSTFLIGVCAGILFARNRFWLIQKRRNIYLLVILLGIYCLWGMYRDKPAHENFRQNGYMALYFALFIIAISLIQGKVKKLLSWKPFQFLGEISYSVYIFQYIVLLICQRYVPGMIGKKDSEIFWPYVLILLIFSSIIYLAFEKPVRRLLTKRVRN